jgi:putative FmdB family regulatory protein
VPIYEYRCENGHEFDVFQRMSDDALTTCQVCGGSAQRVLSAPAVHFKGSGFYTTDYGKKKPTEVSTDTKPKKSESSEASSSSNGSKSDSSSSSSD